MTFERITTIAQATPTTILSAAWGLCDSDVISLKNNERPMTIREVGALADLRGMTLLDILSI